MLHPATIFMLLCVGVFLVAWTFRTFAQNITVTASVLAPLPSSAAEITYPVTNVHFTASTLTVLGTCPSNTYIELYRNGSFSGLANCGPGVTTYQIVTDLSVGSNTLYTRVFNVTDNEGPQSTQIIVWRDNPSIAPAIIPASVPDKLTVTSIDNKNLAYGVTLYTSIYPTIRGTAIPLSYVVSTFHQPAFICSTYADKFGNWSCTLEEPLTEGTHQVDITAKAPSGKVYVYPTFQIISSKNIAPLQTNKEFKAFTINYSYEYKIYTSGKSADWNLSIIGGSEPYAVTILWGDGESSTIVRSNHDSFKIAHTYKLSGKLSNEYIINIRAVDSKEGIANLQLSSLVTFNGARPGSSATNESISSTYTKVSHFIKHWVWLVWPAYAIVLLMTTSFWLGEREEHTKLGKRFRRVRRTRKSKK